MPEEEKLVAPIKPAQPRLGGNIFEGNPNKFDGSCGNDVLDYGSCYEYNFERALSDGGFNASNLEFNKLSTTNSSKQTTNPDGEVVSTSYNDGANLIFTSNAQGANYTNTQSDFFLKKIPSHKEFFSDYLSNKFNILEPSINFQLPTEGFSPVDIEREEQCTRTTANLLYNKKLYSESTNSKYGVDPEIIKPFPTSKFLTSSDSYVVQNMGAFSEVGDDDNVIRNDGFCFISKIGNSSNGFPGTFGSLQIKFRIRLGTTGYTPYIFNNNIGNGSPSVNTLVASSYHLPWDEEKEYDWGEFGPLSTGPLSFRNSIKGWADVFDNQTYFPLVPKFLYWEQSQKDGNKKAELVNGNYVTSYVGKDFKMYDGLSPEFVLNSTHLANRLTGSTHASGHVDTGIKNALGFNYNDKYISNYWSRQSLLNDLQYGPLNNNTVALNVSYDSRQSDIAKRCLDPHYYNRYTHQFIRCPDAVGYGFAPPKSSASEIEYSNGLHSRILHLYLNRGDQEAYRSFQSPNQVFSGSQSERLFGNEQVLSTRRFISQVKLSHKDGKVARGKTFDKYMSGYNSDGKHNGRDQYYRRRNIGNGSITDAGWNAETDGFPADYPIADIMRADLSYRDYEIIVFKGELDYDINTGQETHSAEEGDGWSEGYVEYFRFRTHRTKEQNKTVENYNINEETAFDSEVQFGGQGGSNDNTPNGQEEGEFVSPEIEELKDGDNSVAAEIIFPDDSSQSNRDGVTVTPDGEFFVVNFSENFIHENKEELGYLKIAIIQDTIETEDSKVVTFSDDSRSNGGTGISINPVHDDTVTLVTHDEVGAGAETARVFAGPNLVNLGNGEFVGAGDSQYWPIHGVNGFFLMQHEVDEHIGNIAEINGVDRNILRGIYTAPLLNGAPDINLLSRRITDPTEDLDDGAITDFGWGEFLDINDPLLSRPANQPWPVVGGYANLFTTANWLALKMLWARYGDTEDGEWPVWSYNPDGNKISADSNYYGRHPFTHFYYEPWKVEVRYSVSSSVDRLNTEIGPRCRSGEDNKRIKFHIQDSQSLAHMHPQCGECIERVVPNEVYENNGNNFDALTEGFPSIDQEDDNRSYITIKEND